MTAIHGYDTPNPLANQRLGKTSGQDGTEPTGDGTPEAPPQAGQTDKVATTGGAALLSSSIQSALIANQSVDGLASGQTATVVSANQIAAADILALDTVHALDSNHNGTLSESEIARISPLVAVESTALDTNNDGQVSAGDISRALLSE